MIDAVDRRIVNSLQGGFPLSTTPYADVARELGLTEDDLIDRLQCLLDEGILSRFGPMFHAERMGGALTLAAMSVPDDRYESVADRVNAFPEVAHNYAREHALNMWFVVATERAERIAEVLGEIEKETGLTVHDMPRTSGR